MGNKTSLKLAAAVLAAAAIALPSCSDLTGGEREKDLTASFRVRFQKDFADLTRAAGSLPDTNSFILLVTDSKGGTVYSGSYGAAPELFKTKPGTYTVDVRSSEFSEPLFDSPQYGDTRIVTLQAGQSANVVLNCVQINSGVRLSVDPVFAMDHPGGSLYVRSAEGRLMYSYTEKRTGYFKPGNISLSLSESGKESVLFSRNLSAQQVLSVSLSSASGLQTGAAGGGDRMRIEVDTCRYWIRERYVLGGDIPGGELSSAISVTEARLKAGNDDIWVYGYIVGGDLSSSKCSFEGPFNSRTNLVLAAKSSCRDKEACLSVQLSKGDIRDALNLVDHEENLGRQVFLKGDIVEAYYGIPGLQNITEFELR